MKRTKRLTKRQRHNKSLEDAAAHAMGHALEQLGKVAIDLETRPLFSGRVSSSQPNLQYLPRRGKGLAAADLVRYFNEHHPELRAYVEQHVVKPDLLVIHDESNALRQLQLTPDYTVLEPRAIAYMKETAPRGSYSPEIWKALGIDEEEFCAESVVGMAQAGAVARAKEVAARASARHGAGFVGPVAHPSCLARRPRC